MLSFFPINYSFRYALLQFQKHVHFFVIWAYTQQHNCDLCVNKPAARNRPVLAVTDIFLRQGKNLGNWFSQSRQVQAGVKWFVYFYLTKEFIFGKETYNAAFKDIFVSLSKIALELELNKYPYKFTKIRVNMLAKINTSWRNYAWMSIYSLMIYAHKTQ